MSDINDNIILLDILYIFITNILKLDITKDTNFFIYLYKEYSKFLINIMHIVINNRHYI